MKVTITAPFARVQVEMSAGAAADLIMEAVGLARRCEEYREADLAGSAGAGMERDFGRLMSAVAAEENRGVKRRLCGLMRINRPPTGKRSGRRLRPVMIKPCPVLLAAG